MALAGERFNIDLGDIHPPSASSPTSSLLVRDVQERETSSNAKSPRPPTFKNQSTGFPAHKDRNKRSKFHQIQKDDSSDAKRGTSPALTSLPKPTTTSLNGPSTGSVNRATDPSIDQENKDKLAQMSQVEIEEARKDLISSLSPSLIERLLRKANIEEDETPLEAQADPFASLQDPSSPKVPCKTVTFEETRPQPALSSTNAPPAPSLDFDPDAPPSQPPPDLQPAATFSASKVPPKVHFPRPPGHFPELDPSDPSFQSSLKEHYFPSLPANPSSLSWMSPPTPTEQTAYSASSSTLPPSALRFDFRGRLLPPRLSAQIPTTKGLHHHGHAPESAGYTVPELAHLARSTVPSQRCVAYQTLGRVLYRLGRGDFGPEGEDLCEGLWQLMEQGRVVEGMVEAAARAEGEGNRSVWVTATEACWLWRKGGGRRWKGR